VDFYAIKKKNVIEPPEYQRCAAGILCGSADSWRLSVTPDLPDPSNPAPWLVVDRDGLYQNGNSLRTDGVDIDLAGPIQHGNYGKIVS